MAILQNKFNLPQQIVSAVMRDPYTRGESRISVTQLIQPSRIIQLRRRHEHEIIEDVSDRIWALLGQTCHKILERADDTGAFHEERIFVEIEGWKVSGASDCYVTQQVKYDLVGGKQVGSHETIPPTIRDYKFIKTMAADFPHPDWEQQLNSLAYLWQSQGFPVARLEIVAIYRDWSKAFFERGGGYPPAAQVHRQKMWSFEEQGQFLRQRVTLHKMAEKMLDRELPFCTPEEQWRRAPKFAVMHPKKKRAVKVFDTYFAAEQHITNVLKDRVHFVETRPAVATRCKGFCDVAPFCDQWAAEKLIDAPEQEAA